MNNVIFHFSEKKNTNIISKVNGDFPKDFSVRQKIKILETFLTFSAKTQNLFQNHTEIVRKLNIQKAVGLIEEWLSNYFVTVTLNSRW